MKHFQFSNLLFKFSKHSKANQTLLNRLNLTLFIFFIGGLLIHQEAMAQHGHKRAKLANIDVPLIPTYLGNGKTNPVKRKSQYHDSNGKRRSKAMMNSTIQVTYTGFTPQAEAAFQYAVDIWEATIHSSVPIRIDAKWSALGYDPFTANTLGQAGPGAFFTNGNNPFPSSFYPVALQNNLDGVDNDPGGFHINAEFNSDIPFWYLGTDGNPGATQSDFVSVVLHEIAHGLGFVGGSRLIDPDNDPLTTSIYFGANNDLPIVWSNFIERNDGTSILTYPHVSAALIAALISDDLYFDGPFTTANFGSRPRIYAPDPYESGSSYSHLRDIASSPLMESSIDRGEVKHSIADYELGIFYDIGWAPDAGTGSSTISCVTFNSPINLADFIVGEDANGVWTVNGTGLNPATGFDATNGTFTPSGNAVGSYIFDYSFPLGISSMVTVVLGNATNSGTPFPALDVCNVDMTVINLVDQLTGEEPGGVWAVNAGGAQPIAGFNAAAGTFIPDGNASGLYLFDYTVSSANCGPSTSTVSVNLGVCPPNDLCQNAIQISCGVTVNGTTNFATNEIHDDCFGSTTDLQGVWYAFVGNGSMTSLSTCSSGTNFDTELRIFEGTCTSFVCAEDGYNDDDFDCPISVRHSLIEFYAELGKTYHIWVAPYNTNQATGDFELTLTCAPCSDTADADGDGIPACFDSCPNNRDTALDFDNNYVEVPANALFDLSTSDFAFEAWVYPEGTNFRTIISKGAGSDPNTDYIFQIMDEFNTSFDPGKISLWLSDGTTGQRQYGTTVIQQDVWTHVAVSVDNSGTNPEATFYVNGVLDGTGVYTDVTLPLLNSNSPLLIGMQGDVCQCNFFDGRIDDIGIWNRTLSQEQIQASISAPYFGNEFGLIAHYDFNDADACITNTSNTTLVDKAGNNNGTLMNFELEQNCQSNWTRGHLDTNCDIECQPNLENNLIGYWNFDSNVEDHKGPHDGTIIGSGSTYSAGAHGNGIELDGTNYINVGNNPNLNFTNKFLSISAWFKVDVFDKTWQTLISKGESANFRIARFNATNNMSYNGGFPDVMAPININDGQFHHIAAVTRPNQSKSIYIDGALIMTVPIGVNINDNGAHDLLIGSNPRMEDLGVNRRWKGIIDDIAIWDIPLNQCDIDLIYNAGMSVAEIIGLDVCPPDYVGLVGNHATNSIYETDGDIGSTQVITTPADIIYDSATSIEMSQGFEVASGSLFHAFIDGCN